MRLPTPGIGLFGDPREVVRVSVDDRPCGHAGDFVGMLALGACNDLGYPFTARVQRCPAFGPLVHLALPPADRPHGGEVVHAGVPRDPNREAAMMADNGPELVRHCLEWVTVPPWGEV